MKILSWLAFPLFSIGAMAGDGSYQAEFYQAQSIQGTDREGAIEGMKRSFQLAVAAGNADYATSAGLNAAYLMYEKDQSVAGGRFAREVILALDAIEYNIPGGDALRRVQLFGLMQRALQMDGKIGAAWQANRAAAETLRGKKLSADGDGSSITVAELKTLSPPLRSYGWRLIEREAEILDLVGRSLDARALLDEAITALGDDWNAIPEVERFYAFKLAARRCELLDYLGYEKQAIELQQKLSVEAAGIAQIRISGLTLQFNLLRNLSQWEGPSENLLEQARGISSQLNADGRQPGALRLLAKMELDLRESKAALEALRNSSKQEAALGNFLESAYADRDSLVSRAKTGEENLDPEFMALLAKMRGQGNKRGEPVLYVAYGNYLLARKRPHEAIAMFQEALRLKRSFGLILHEPKLIHSLFEARLAAGDLDGAKTTLAELEAFLQQHEKDLPAARLADAQVLRAMALGKLGEKGAAKAVLELARRSAAGLPEYRRRLLEPDQEERIISPSKGTAPAAVAARLRIQPLEVVTTAALKREAHTRFSVANPGPLGVAGEWVVAGPGAEKSAGSVHFTAGKPDVTLKMPLTVASGGDSSLKVIMAAAEGIPAAQVRVAWHQAGGGDAPASVWNARWEAGTAGRVVLDASALEANPFRSISLFHEFAIPVGEEAGIPFRLRSPVPLRFEYYDAASDQLLAVDANGNGDFTEAGDLHTRGPSGIACAVIPIRNSGADLTVEIRISASTGEALAVTPALVLETEIHRNGAWVKEAESTLK